jgi:hypothetical protein
MAVLASLCHCLHTVHVWLDTTTLSHPLPPEFTLVHTQTHLLCVLCLKVCIQLLIDALMVVQPPQPVEPALADLLSVCMCVKREGGRWRCVLACLCV